MLDFFGIHPRISLTVVSFARIEYTILQGDVPIRRAGVGLVLEAKGRGPAHVAELAPGETGCFLLSLQPALTPAFPKAGAPNGLER